MKTTFKLSRLFSAVAALLLLAVVPFTLTSCDDDDDAFTNTVTINGETRKISEAVVFSVGEQNGENFYTNYLKLEREDGEYDLLGFYYPGRNLGKTLDLTKDLFAYDKETGEYLFATAVVIIPYNEEGHDTDDKFWATKNTYMENKQEGDFQWGTIYMNISDKVFTVKLSCKTKDTSDSGESTIRVSYSGKYTVLEP